METRKNHAVVGNGEDNDKTTYVVVNSLGFNFNHPADMFLVLRYGAGELLGRVNPLSEVGFRHGDAGVKKLWRLSEGETEFRHGGGGEELVRPLIIANEELVVRLIFERERFIASIFNIPDCHQEQEEDRDWDYGTGAGEEEFVRPIISNEEDVPADLVPPAPDSRTLAPAGEGAPPRFLLALVDETVVQLIFNIPDCYQEEDADDGAGEELARAIISDVPADSSLKHVLGSPMPQTVSDTCALIARSTDPVPEHVLLGPPPRMVPGTRGTWAPGDGAPSRFLLPLVEKTVVRLIVGGRCIPDCHGHLEEELVGASAIISNEDWIDDMPADFSLKHVLGLPITQTVGGTCALVACTVCLEARHRLMFEREHGRGTFPCRAAAPRKLRAACFREIYLDKFTGRFYRTWAPGRGAEVARVLAKLMEIGGARTTNAPPPSPFFLPLAGWTCYDYDEDLTHTRAARLIFEQGPCVGTIFSVPGCRREDRKMLRKKDPERYAMHGLVCFGYRYTKKNRLKIHVLDNQRPIGTTRWIDFREIDSLHVLYVHPLPPRHLLDRSTPLVYPLSLPALPML